MTSPSAEPLPIRALASLTGVNPVTLRAWERRYGLLRPERTASGRRVYGHEHVELVRRVLALTSRGIPIGQVRAALEAAPAEPAPASRADAWHARLELMAGAITRLDEGELDHLYDEVLAVHPVEQVTRRLLVPLLVRLGERWRDLPGAIAEEHFFATYMRSKLGARLLHRTRYAEGPRLLAACAPGEQHEIGLLLFALEAREAGMRPVILGADTPFDEVAAAQARARCDAIVISCSVDPPAGVLQRELRSLVRKCAVPVFVGGGAATRQRALVVAAGAIPLGTEVDDGVRMMRERLAAGKAKR